MRRLELLIPPPVVMVAIGLFMWALSATLPALAFSWQYNGLISVALALSGLAISLVAVIVFKRSNTTVDPRNPSRTARLVNSGIYSVSRNPMYLGVLLMLFGWGLYLGNILSILCPFIFIAYITRFQIIPEERLLEAKFGEEFLRYKNTARRWL